MFKLRKPHKEKNQKSNTTAHESHNPQNEGIKQLVQRATDNPQSLSSNNVLQLQRVLGNAKTQSLLKGMPPTNSSLPSFGFMNPSKQTLQRWENGIVPVEQNRLSPATALSIMKIINSPLGSVRHRFEEFNDLFGDDKFGMGYLADKINLLENYQDEVPHLRPLIDALTEFEAALMALPAITRDDAEALLNMQVDSKEYYKKHNTKGRQQGKLLNKVPTKFLRKKLFKHVKKHELGLRGEANNSRYARRYRAKLETEAQAKAALEETVAQELQAPYDTVRAGYGHFYAYVQQQNDTYDEESKLSQRYLKDELTSPELRIPEHVGSELVSLVSKELGITVL